LLVFYPIYHLFKKEASTPAETFSRCPLIGGKLKDDMIPIHAARL
jgi:hypothetical protein